jgi:hypothetical protein
MQYPIPQRTPAPSQVHIPVSAVAPAPLQEQVPVPVVLTDSPEDQVPVPVVVTDPSEEQVSVPGVATDPPEEAIPVEAPTDWCAWSILLVMSFFTWVKENTTNGRILQFGANCTGFPAVGRAIGKVINAAQNVEWINRFLRCIALCEMLRRLKWLRRPFIYGIALLLYTVIILYLFGSNAVQNQHPAIGGYMSKFDQVTEAARAKHVKEKSSELHIFAMSSDTLDATRQNVRHMHLMQTRDLKDTVFCAWKFLTYEQCKANFDKAQAFYVHKPLHPDLVRLCANNEWRRDYCNTPMPNSWNVIDQGANFTQKMIQTYLKIELKTLEESGVNNVAVKNSSNITTVSSIEIHSSVATLQVYEAAYFLAAIRNNLLGSHNKDMAEFVRVIQLDKQNQLVKNLNDYAINAAGLFGIPAGAVFSVTNVVFELGIFVFTGVKNIPNPMGMLSFNTPVGKVDPVEMSVIILLKTPTSPTNVIQILGGKAEKFIEGAIAKTSLVDPATRDIMFADTHRGEEVVVHEVKVKEHPQVDKSRIPHNAYWKFMDESHDFSHVITVGYARFAWTILQFLIILGVTCILLYQSGHLTAAMRVFYGSLTRLWNWLVRVPTPPPSAPPTQPGSPQGPRTRTPTPSASGTTTPRTQERLRQAPPLNHAALARRLAAVPERT